MSRIGLLALLFVLENVVPAFAESRTLAVEEAIRLALEANPDVRRYGEEIAAANARVAGASTLFKENPIVTLSAGPRYDVSGRTLDYGVQLLQPLEIGGQRAARIAAAEAGLAASRDELAAVRNAIAAEVRVQFGTAIAATERLKIADEVLATAAEGVRAADERIRAGAAPTLELNSARVEIGRATRERAQAANALALALAKLRVTIAIDPATQIVLQGNLPQAGQAPGPGVEATLLAEALANRAQIAQVRHALDSAVAEARLASRERIPTPRLGISYAREAGSDTSVVQGVIAFDLPLFNRNVAARGITSARVRQLRITQTEVERQIKQDVLLALVRVRVAEDAAKGYGADVVKAMKDNMELVTESYRVGKIDFLQLVVIRRQAIEARREFIDVLEELGAARVALDLALGRAARTP